MTPDLQFNYFSVVFLMAGPRACGSVFLLIVRVYVADFYLSHLHGAFKTWFAESECRTKLKGPDLSTIFPGVTLISPQGEFWLSHLSLYGKGCGSTTVFMWSFNVTFWPQMSQPVLKDTEKDLIEGNSYTASSKPACHDEAVCSVRSDLLFHKALL